MPARDFPILFVTATRIGDAVLSSGLVKRLHDEIPNARFTIVAGPLAAPLFRDTPGLEALIPMRKRPLGRHWLDLWARAQRRRWGLVVDMRGSALGRLVRTRKLAVRRALRPGAPPVHKVVEAARLLRLEDDPPAPYLFTSAETEAAADRLLAATRGPILAVAPAANWIGKTWPSERFAVTAAALTGDGGPMPGGRVVLLGGEDDRLAAEATRRAIPRERLVDLVGRTDLLTAYAVLKRARLFVGNDSGLMHLAAAAAGAPTLGLFGPSDERLYAPWGDAARFVRTPRSLEAIRAVDPDLNRPLNHMGDLKAQTVIEAATRLVRETEVARAGAAAARREVRVA